MTTQSIDMLSIVVFIEHSLAIFARSCITKYSLLTICNERPVCALRTLCTCPLATTSALPVVGREPEHTVSMPTTLTPTSWSPSGQPVEEVYRTSLWGKTVHTPNVPCVAPAARCITEVSREACFRRDTCVSLWRFNPLSKGPAAYNSALMLLMLCSLCFSSSAWDGARSRDPTNFLAGMTDPATPRLRRIFLPRIMSFKHIR